MKTCKTCNKRKRNYQFKTTKNGYTYIHCKACISKKIRENRTPEEKAKQQEFRLKWRKDIKRKLVDYFGNKCSICNQSFPPEVYDFHHLDPTLKDGGVASRGSFEKCLEEAKKCQLLCANCHRVVHTK